MEILNNNNLLRRALLATPIALMSLTGCDPLSLDTEHTWHFEVHCEDNNDVNVRDVSRTDSSVAISCEYEGAQRAPTSIELSDGNGLIIDELPFTDNSRMLHITLDHSNISPNLQSVNIDQQLGLATITFTRGEIEEVIID